MQKEPPKPPPRGGSCLHLPLPREETLTRPPPLHACFFGTVLPFPRHLTQTRDFPRNCRQELYKGHVHHRPVLHSERKRLGFQCQPRPGLHLRNHHLQEHGAMSAATSAWLLSWPTGTGTFLRAQAPQISKDKGSYLGRVLIITNTQVACVKTTQSSSGVRLVLRSATVCTVCRAHSAGTHALSSIT